MVVVGWGENGDFAIGGQSRVRPSRFLPGNWYAVVRNDVVYLVAGPVSRRSPRTHPSFVGRQDGGKTFMCRRTLFVSRERGERGNEPEQPRRGG